MADVLILDLARNVIGDEGMSALTSALVRGALPKLTQLFIDSPSVGLKEFCSSSRRVQLYF